MYSLFWPAENVRELQGLSVDFHSFTDIQFTIQEPPGLTQPTSPIGAGGQIQSIKLPHPIPWQLI